METGEDEDICPGQEIDFCTLGMFIIDEIHYQPPKTSVYDVIGGAGSYSVLGARLFSQGSESKKVGWIVDKGSDFPSSIETTIKSWKTSCFFRTDESRLTTRGWNKYDTSENRTFRYATLKRRLDEKSLAECEPLLRAKAFHLICSPTRCIDLVKGILHLRKGIPGHPPRPLFIWEPVPDLCVPDQLLETTRALRYVDIYSPNHNELGALMGTPAMLPNGDVDREFVEDATEQLLGSMPLATFAIVVRAGKDGCYIAKNGGGGEKWLAKTSRRGPPKEKNNSNNENKRPRPAHANAGRGLTADADFEELFARLSSNSANQCDSESPEEEEEEPDWGIWMWLPAVHIDPSRVVDPTGGGNAFLGGLAIALARGASLEGAAKQGMVAASFAVEQVGMPTLGKDFLGYDTWNGVVPDVRAWNYEARMCNGPTIGDQFQ